LKTDVCISTGHSLSSTKKSQKLENVVVATWAYYDEME